MTESRTAPDTGDRLAKVMARSGLCSRRDAEGWIAEGRVTVNGKVVKTPAFNVTERDKIAVDGKPLAARQGTRVWLYHKPPGLVVTEKDPEGRPTIFEALEEKGLPRVLTVGRLDINTEGLLLLTNDGGLKRVLELPATGWLRRYRVRAYGSVTQAALDKLQDGMEVDGVKYGPIEATLEREQGHNVWIVVALREGKNREVKNVLGALGLEVNRLIRVSYGPFQLGDLPVGEIETVKDRVLQEQLGERLAAEANADFVSDLPEPRRAPARGTTRGFGREERPAGRPRKIHFDDGRAPLEYTPGPAPRRKPGEDDSPPRRPGRPGAGKPPRSGKPADDRAPRGRAADAGRGDRPGGDRPRRSHGDRPDAREAGEWTRKPRAPRSAAGFDDRSAAPKRSYGSKSHTGDAPKSRSRNADGPARPSRRDGPSRPPRSPRPEGAPPRSRSYSDGPRPARSPRSEAGGPDRPSRGKPAGAGRPPRPEGGAPKGRGGPRKDGGASAPRSSRPGTGGAPRKGGGPSSGPRSPRPSGGAPRGGPRKPRG